MLFSIIIPCYNHGKFIVNALKSIEKIEGVSYEIIIVDDGSTDEHTIQVLKELKAGGLNVITQKNSGPSVARNTGIKQAKGRYIIPLDSDDKIRPEYLPKAKELFESNPAISVVYSNFQTFGEASVLQQYKEYNLQDLLLGNTVGAALVYKKEAWEMVGGYDETFRHGWEDYELYINFAYHGLKFKHLNIIGYDYYLHQNSRERTFLKNNNGVNHLLERLETKYPDFFSRKSVHDKFIGQIRRTPIAMFIKITFAAFLPKYYDRFVKSGKIKKYVNM